MPRTPNIVLLTGAGLSAESGLATFRDPTGIWAKYDWREVATPEGFAKNPALVHDFYNMRRRAHAEVKPNAAHVALADLQRANPNATIVTQNVDGLQEAAGATNLIHMHGTILDALCTHCSACHRWHGDLSVSIPCPTCKATGGMRPDVVWFGETPYHMALISRLLTQCELFISIGTSGHVYPAAGFVEIAQSIGAKTVELNLEPSQSASHFDETIYGPATEVVPRYVAQLIAEYA